MINIIIMAALLGLIIGILIYNLIIPIKCSYQFKEPILLKNYTWREI